MSNTQNDKIMDALWEDFLDLYKVSDSFEKACDAASWDLFEAWDMERLFDKLVENDFDLFLHNKRVAVDALTMFNEARKALNHAFINKEIPMDKIVFPGERK
jgi:hypothetical protein